MSIGAFADALAAVTIAGVTTRIAGIPKTLAAEQLPAQWVDMPSALINPAEGMSTLYRSAAVYTATLYIAVEPVAKEGGLPDSQRTKMLAIADAVEEWAEATPYIVEIALTPRIPVAAVEYRGITARVTADDME